MCAALRMPRVSSESLTKVSASSMTSVGPNFSIVRKMADGEMLDVERARGTIALRMVSKVVFPKRFVGDVTARIGETSLAL